MSPADQCTGDGTTVLTIRYSTTHYIPEIELMVSDFVRGHPAEAHRRPTQALREAFFGDSPVANLLIAERSGNVLGMIQWPLIYDMFWGMFGAEAGWLYVKPQFRRSGIAAALVARVCADTSRAGAQYPAWGRRRRAFQVVRARRHRQRRERLPPLWQGVSGIREAGRTACPADRARISGQETGIAAGRSTVSRH